MPAFTLYGALGSTNTDRIRLTLAEGGFTDYDYVPLNLAKGEQKSPENLSRHPWGKVPVLVEPDGFTLYESRAICRYLAPKYAPSLLPSPTGTATGDAVRAAALFDQAQSVETVYFGEPAGRLSFERFVKRFRGMEVDEAVVADATRALEQFFDVAEGLLAKAGGEGYMAGRDFSLVDVFYIPVVQRLFVCGAGEMVMGRKEVRSWWERCLARPAVSDLMEKNREAMLALKR